MAETRSLSLLQQTDAAGTLVQSLALSHRSGAFARGPAKLLQNVVAELFTLRGSVRFAPRYGCDLVHYLGISNVTSVAEITHGINVAVSDVQQNILSRTVGDEPLDEMLDRIVVERLQQDLDRIIVVLRVITRAGSSISYDLAITF